MISRAYRAVAVSAATLFVLAGSAGAQDGPTFRVVEKPAEDPASVTARAQLAPRFTDQRADAFMLPLFRVDRASPGGETTLIAVRNSTGQAHGVDIAYFVDHVFTPGADPDLVQPFTLQPHEVVTVNLRDLPEITGGQGGDALVRGWVMVSHSEGVGDTLSADWLRVNPDQDFATGGRMIDIDHTYTCTQWDLRYLIDGGFSGGTRLEIFTDTPLAGSDPSFLVTFYDEPGNHQGTVAVFTARQVEEIDVSELLASLPGTPSSFGSMVVTFQGGTNGGMVSGAYNAEDRYSVGINGSCIVP